MNLKRRVVKLLEKVSIKSVVRELLEKVPTKPLDRRVGAEPHVYNK